MTEDEFSLRVFGGKVVLESLLASLCRSSADDPKRKFIPCGRDDGDRREKDPRIAIEICRNSFRSSRCDRDLVRINQLPSGLIRVEDSVAPVDLEAGVHLFREFRSEFIIDGRASLQMRALQGETIPVDETCPPASSK